MSRVVDERIEATVESVKRRRIGGHTVEFSIGYPQQTFEITLYGVCRFEEGDKIELHLSNLSSAK